MKRTIFSLVIFLVFLFVFSYYFLNTHPMGYGEKYGFTDSLRFMSIFLILFSIPMAVTFLVNQKIKTIISSRKIVLFVMSLFFICFLILWGYLCFRFPF